MSRLQFFFCFFFAVQCVFADYNCNGVVTELTDADYDAFLRDYPTCMIEWYAPWCPHCKTLKKPFDYVAAQYADNENIKFARIDADKYRELSDKNQIQFYPTIFFHCNGNRVEYTGERTSSAILRFLRPRVC